MQLLLLFSQYFLYINIYICICSLFFAFITLYIFQFYQMFGWTCELVFHLSLISINPCIKKKIIIDFNKILKKIFFLALLAYLLLPSSITLFIAYLFSSFIPFLFLSYLLFSQNQYRCASIFVERLGTRRCVQGQLTGMQNYEDSCEITRNADC